MQELYLKSLRMIKILNIKNKKQYNKLKMHFLILNIESLKYITQERNFKEIIKLAKEVWEDFFFCEVSHKKPNPCYYSIREWYHELLWEK